MAYDCNHIKEGQTMVYEGRDTKAIHVKPLFVIKVEGRVICGALRNRITFIAADKKNIYRDGQS